MNIRQMIINRSEEWKRTSPFIEDYSLRDIKNYKAMKNVVLIGMRRIGKSNYLSNIYHSIKDKVSNEQILFVDFDDPSFIGFDFKDIQNEATIEFINTITNLVHEESIKYVFFDEIQSLEVWSRYLKGMVDKHSETHFYATGSDSFSILKTNESGVGRYDIVFMGPLMYKEFIEMKLGNSFEDYVENWFIPDSQTKSIHLQYKAIVEKQFGQSNISKKNIELVYRAISLNPGIVFNNYNLSKTIKDETGGGPDHSQVLKILEFLINSNLIIALPGIDSFLRKNKTKIVKYYPVNWNSYKMITNYSRFTDIPYESIPRRGNVFENIIVSNIYSSLRNFLERDNFFTMEVEPKVDLFINDIAFEIKSYDVFEIKDTQSLGKLFNVFEKQKQSCPNFIVIHTGSTKKMHGISFVNHEEFLLKQMWKKAISN